MNSPFSFAMSIVQSKAHRAQRAHKVESIVDDIRDEYGIETDDYIDDVQILKHKLKASSVIKDIEIYIEDIIQICEILKERNKQ